MTFSLAKMAKTALALGLIVSLGACASIGRSLGMGKNPPDEFVVVEKQPLQMPPNFDLRPPRPGEAQPQQVPTSTNVVQALFPGLTELPPRPSAGEQALVSQLGDTPVEARTRLRSEDDIIVEKGLLLPDILAAGPRYRQDDGATIERVGSTPVNNQ